MSGQPLRGPNDASKFRKAYMATLQLQGELNKKNFDANALYRRTGVVPTQITDYRSTSEKIADLINLRILIRSQLRQIADAQNAEDIAQSLTADELVFASQSIDFIIKELKPKFKFGILKDIFLQYLRTYMSNEQSNQLARAGMAPPGPGKQAPNVEIQYPTQQQLVLLEKLIAEDVAGRGVPNAEEAQIAVKKLINLLYGYDYNTLIRGVANANVVSNVRSLLEIVFMGIPGDDLIQEYIDELQSTDDPIELERKIQDLINLLGDVTSDENIESRNEALSLLKSKEREDDEQSSGTTAEAQSTVALSAVRERKEQKPLSFEQQLDKLTVPRLKELLESIGVKPTSKQKKRPDLKDLARIHQKAVEEQFVRVRDLDHSPGVPPSRSIQGRGVGVDYSKGIDPLPKFAPIGNYFINLQKLKDDIVTCCRPNGKNVSEWKSIRVSLPLANVIRKLVNKGKPTFDELSQLSEEDKALFAEFIRKAKLEIDIPSSKIDREDLSKFEIMKGQIMSGQDNKEYIKEFKLLIVKLMHQGRLPKGQGKGILVELTELGY